MGLNFRDAFNGMAQVMPQIVNNYHQYLQLQMEAQKAQAYVGYMEAEKGATYARTEREQFNLAQEKERAPYDLMAIQRESELKDILLQKEQSAQAAIKSVYGSQTEYDIKNLKQTDEISAQQLELLKNNILKEKAQILQAETETTNSNIRSGLEQTRNRYEMLERSVNIIGGMDAIGANIPSFNKWASEYKGDINLEAIQGAMARGEIQYDDPSKEKDIRDMLKTVEQIKLHLITSGADFEATAIQEIKTKNPKWAPERVYTEYETNYKPFRDKMNKDIMTELYKMLYASEQALGKPSGTVKEYAKQMGYDWEKEEEEIPNPYDMTKKPFSIWDYLPSIEKLEKFKEKSGMSK